MARVRAMANGRLDSRNRVANSASSRASTDWSRNGPLGVPGTGGRTPPAHQDRRSSPSRHVSEPSSSSAWWRVSPGRSPACHAPRAAGSSKSCITDASVSRSTSTSGGGGMSSGPSRSSMSAFEHQKSSTDGPERSRYTPAMPTRVSPIVAKSPACNPISSLARSLSHTPGPVAGSSTSTLSRAPPRTRSDTVRRSVLSVPPTEGNVLHLCPPVARTEPIGDRDERVGGGGTDPARRHGERPAGTQVASAALLPLELHGGAAHRRGEEGHRCEGGGDHRRRPGHGRQEPGAAAEEEGSPPPRRRGEGGQRGAKAVHGRRSLGGGLVIGSHHVARDQQRWARVGPGRPPRRHGHGSTKVNASRMASV